MNWIPCGNVPPKNKEAVLVWRAWEPGEFRVARYYDEGTEMDDGNHATMSGYFIQSKIGKRVPLRAGATFFLPLELPDSEKTGDRDKTYQRGYRAALLTVMQMLEEMSRTAVGSEAWFIKDFHERLQKEARRSMMKGALKRGKNDG